MLKKLQLEILINLGNFEEKNLIMLYAKVTKVKGMEYKYVMSMPFF
jgi:hypothetical protein